MTKYVFKRLGLMLVTFIIITMITFLLIRVLPRELLSKSAGKHWATTNR